MRKTVGSNRFRSLRLAGALILSALMLTACGVSELSTEMVSEKQITITAKNAAKDDALESGALVVKDGEEIEISSDAMEKGEIRVEVYEGNEEQDIDDDIRPEGEPVLTANISGKEAIAGTVPAGVYCIKVIVMEEATGTVDVTVKPAA